MSQFNIGDIVRMIRLGLSWLKRQDLSMEIMFKLLIRIIHYTDNMDS